MIQRYVPIKSFTVRFAVRCEQESGFQPDRNGLVYFTDYSKKNDSSVFRCVKMAQKTLNSSPRQYTMAFHAEVFATKAYATETTDEGYKNQNMCIL